MLIRITKFIQVQEECLEKTQRFEICGTEGSKTIYLLANCKQMGYLNWKI